MGFAPLKFAYDKRAVKSLEMAVRQTVLLGGLIVCGLGEALAGPMSATATAHDNPLPEPKAEAAAQTQESQKMAGAFAAPPADGATPTQATLAPRATKRHALAGTSEGVFGSTMWGGHGIHRTTSAFALRPGALALTISDAYWTMRNVFIPKDQDRQSQQEIDVVYAPILGFEFSASSRAVAHRYVGEFERVLQTLGSPTFRLKYGRGIKDVVALGVQAHWNLPTSAHGTGLNARASSYTLEGLVSVMLGRRLELMANAGFTYDQSARLFPNERADAVQALAYQINHTNQVPWGVGGQGRITLGRVVELTPYLEVTGGIGTARTANRKNNPLRVTTGIKLYPAYFPVAELGLGADVALGGRAMAHSPYGGQPRWNIFGRVSVHIDNIISRPSASLAQSHCQESADCADGSTCEAGLCRAPKVVIPTFVLAGSILDAETHEAVLGASLQVTGFEGAALAVSEDDGGYRSWPLECGNDTIQVKVHAPGYLPETQDVVRLTQAGEQKVNFALTSDKAKPSYGTLKASLRDLESGERVRKARIVIPAQNRKLLGDARGMVAARLKPGHYQVRFVAPGYLPQTRSFVLRAGEVVMLNVDLTPRPRR